MSSRDKRLEEAAILEIVSVQSGVLAKSFDASDRAFHGRRFEKKKNGTSPFG